MFTVGWAKQNALIWLDEEKPSCMIYGIPFSPHPYFIIGTIVSDNHQLSLPLNLFYYYHYCYNYHNSVAFQALTKTCPVSHYFLIKIINNFHNNIHIFILIIIVILYLKILI
ncbi:GSCOCG00000202001-RA-CDS [Cotesia congregata]|nr:GSCOCG00000202001-RA-CDS [Cotesia congregata]